MPEIIPVVVFAYARPDHLLRTLDSLRANRPELIYAFSDAPRNPSKQAAVEQVRHILRSIDWCQVIYTERSENWGTGRSIISGVTRVLSEHNAVIVFEDDLVCVPGTLQYLSVALQYYRDMPSVMSVTGWTHPLVTPHGLGDQPYFDGRAECWVWGTWARAWNGMDREAKALVRDCRARGIDVERYGADLPQMAEREIEQNIWAVRWSYLHILAQGLCLRPPHSLVEHIGFDALAERATDGSKWSNPRLRPCPPLPSSWPVPIENPECSRLWKKGIALKPSWPVRIVNKARRTLRSASRRA